MALDINGFVISEVNANLSVMTLDSGTGTITLGTDPTASISLNGVATLESTGGLALPNNPAFAGRRTDIANATASYPWFITAVDLNRSSAFAAGQLFSCPMAGVYFVSLNVILQATNSTTPSSTASGYIGITKNDVLYAYSHMNTNDNWHSTTVCALISCAVNDTIKYAVNTAPTQVGSTAGAYSSDHNMATIWFLG